MALNSTFTGCGTRKGRVSRAGANRLLDPSHACSSGSANDRSLQLARAAAFIERNLSSQDLTPASVADAVHVSRSGLYRLFEESGGVNRYVLNARLDRAWNVLVDPERPRRVSLVAFDCGFRSEAHFCRAFRRAFGVTPGFVRDSGAGPTERPH